MLKKQGRKPSHTAFIFLYLLAYVVSGFLARLLDVPFALNLSSIVTIFIPLFILVFPSFFLSWNRLQYTNIHAASPSGVMLSVQLWCCHWLIHLIRVRLREKRQRGEREVGNRIEGECRIGRVWSLCWIALEIGSINLSSPPRFVPFLWHTNIQAYTQCAPTASHKCNGKKNGKTPNGWLHFPARKTAV